MVHTLISFMFIISICEQNRDDDSQNLDLYASVVRNQRLHMTRDRVR